jgi:glycosyltransferase involved in cell wall biosynthesis
MFFPHMILGAVSPLCPVVSTWHDMSYAMMPELLSPRQRLWHNVQMMPRWQAQRARHIIAVSQSTADDVIACYGVNFERVSVVHSGIDSSLKRPSKEDIALYRRQSMLPDSFILALGTVEPRKNIETLVGAFERIAEHVPCDLVVVGSPGWQCERLMMRIARSPMRSRIHVRGAVDPGERALLIGAANVVAYPSYLEGFGFPPLEALACGVPVVVSHNSSIAEVTGQWAVLVDPYREDSVARGLVYALEDMKLRDSVQGVAHTIRATYSWEIAAQKTLEILTRSMVY